LILVSSKLNKKFHIILSHLWLAGYPKSEYLKSTFSISINIGTRAASMARPMPYFNAYTQVKAFLKDMMKSIMEHIQKHPYEPVPALFKEMGMGLIAKDLQHQIDAYWWGEYPFK
jgi:hypothetical protein